MAKPRKNLTHQTSLNNPAQLLMEAEAFLDSLTLGTWLPNVDLCETNELYTIRVELPGVDLEDISLTIQDSVVRVSGVKREPNISQKLLCYYCLERRYGKFLREINLESVVDARRATGQLDNGVLIVELPKLVDRRGRVLEIPILRKKR
jgi:HSP20 family protein